MEKCLICGKVMRIRMYSNSWLMKWYDCKHCGNSFKRGYTEEECRRIGLVTKHGKGNIFFPNLIMIKKGGGK